MKKEKFQQPIKTVDYPKEITEKIASRKQSIIEIERQIQTLQLQKEAHSLYLRGLVDYALISNDIDTEKYEVVADEAKIEVFEK